MWACMRVIIIGLGEEGGACFDVFSPMVSIDYVHRGLSLICSCLIPLDQ
jgi:hypothetical protein